MEESLLIDKLLGNEQIDLSSHKFCDCFNEEVKQLFFDEDTSEIMINGSGAIYIEKNGLPLNGNELRDEYFGNKGEDLTYVQGAEKRKFKKSELPIKYTELN